MERASVAGRTDEDAFKVCAFGPWIFAAVFDGHGLDRAGAATVTVSGALKEAVFRCVRAELRRGEAPGAALRQGLRAAEDALLHEPRVDTVGLGSTALCTLVNVESARVYAINVGDSQLVVRSGGAVEATKQHRPADAAEAARIQAAGGTVTRGRVGSRMASLGVSRSIGDSAFNPDAACQDLNGY